MGICVEYGPGAAQPSQPRGFKPYLDATSGRRQDTDLCKYLLKTGRKRRQAEAPARLILIRCATGRRVATFRARGLALPRGRIIMLAGVNQYGFDLRVALHLAHERRDFDEVRSSSDDTENSKALTHF